ASCCLPRDLPPTERDTLSLHDALPIFLGVEIDAVTLAEARRRIADLIVQARLTDAQGTTGPSAGTATATAQPLSAQPPGGAHVRSEEHTSELQSRENLVCRLLLEKKKQ